MFPFKFSDVSLVFLNLKVALMFSHTNKIVIATITEPCCDIIVVTSTHLCISGLIISQKHGFFKEQLNLFVTYTSAYFLIAKKAFIL